ncbi:MAG: flagellar type III secretion system pore protein FliP [Defluviitaleaceae bacterium]|nr:flagellar type III secretion system pore protein FliP [Defluviitaleaceae bacterium]MCL2261760.1 flagellar type III secretion system pore protein FliP [Defluviitaleaceae bacterium]
MSRLKKFQLVFLALFFLGLFGGVQTVNAAGLLNPDTSFFPGISVEVGATDDPDSVVATLQVLFLFSIIAIAPSLLVLLTSFTRIVIVLSFTRQAMATQQMPPNQVLVGIAVFLTLFIMAPQFAAINENAIVPLGAGDIDTAQAIEAAWEPIRDFMFTQLDNDTGERAVALFMDLGDLMIDDINEIPPSVLIPAFILNEITIGFLMGFIIYLPFIVIDMVVASVLMSMGMMMLPPAMISMPFKIMVFILSGGWRMIIENMLLTFRM